MKVIKLKIETELSFKDYSTQTGKEEIIEDLKQELFDVCEEWVIRGKEPKIIIELDGKVLKK